ncbi:MAG: C40 family peptidase [Streptosporangiaceae bacterium]
MHTPLPGIKARLRLGAAAATAVMAVFGLSTYAVTAGAAPQPSLAQALAEVNQDNSQYDQANQQYDQVAQQVKQAQQKLAAVDNQVAANKAEFTKLRGAVAQIAAASYENGDTTSVAGLLTSSDPNTVLNGASLLLEISGSRNQQVKEFLAVVRQLKSSQEQAQRTKNALAAIEQQKQQNQQHANHVLNNAKAVLASLTPQQQQTVAANSIGAGATTATAYTGSTATEGGKAAAFAVAEAQAACPYVYGGTGPCADGFDCSGLAQAAWASAGLAIPRTTYDDWANLPHISLSALEPGDLIEYDGEGHVAVYIGNGMIVDAPHTGADVEEISINEDWYAQNEDGAVRP